MAELRADRMTTSLGSTYSEASDTSGNSIGQFPKGKGNLQLHVKAPLLYRGSTDGEVPSPIQSWRAVLAEIRSSKRLWSTVVVSLAVGLTAVLTGYTLGYPSSALLDLRNTSSEYYQKGSTSENLFGAMAPIGAVVGGIIAGWSADTLGRKPTLILTALPNIIGWTLIGVSWYLHNTCVDCFSAVILLGRFFSGVGMGWTMLTAPMYIGEISVPVMRGLFSALPQLGLASGILLVYCIGSIEDIHYHVIAFVATGLGLLFVFLVAFVPETPRYLISKGKREKAIKVLKWLRGSHVDVNGELFELDNILYRQRKMSLKEFLGEMARKNVFISFLLLLFMMVFQQLSGINALVFYGAPILQKAGVSHTRFAALLSIGITEVLTTALTAFIVDLFGRKVMLISSLLIMAFSCTGLATHLYFACPPDNSFPPDYSNVPLGIASIILLIIGYSLGLGAIPWTLMTELLPLNVRGSLGGVLSAVNWSCTALVTGLYLVYSEHVGKSVAWWTFAGINVLGIMFVATFLPETKGKKLEVIEHQLTIKFKLCT